MPFCHVRRENHGFSRFVPVQLWKTWQMLFAKHTHWSVNAIPARVCTGIIVPSQLSRDANTSKTLVTSVCRDCFSCGTNHMSAEVCVCVLLTMCQNSVHQSLNPKRSCCVLCPCFVCLFQPFLDESFRFHDIKKRPSVDGHFCEKNPIRSEGNERAGWKETKTKTYMRRTEREERLLQRGTIENRLSTSPNAPSPFCFSSETNVMYLRFAALEKAAWLRVFNHEIRDLRHHHHQLIGDMLRLLLTRRAAICLISGLGKDHVRANDATPPEF